LDDRQVSALSAEDGTFNQSITYPDGTTVTGGPAGGGIGGATDAVRNALDFVGAGDGTGGAAIQAAINDLPARGGLVFIPMEGPDDGVTNGQGLTEDNVWEVTSEITDADNAVHLLGAGPGWGDRKSGTALICSDSSVGSMVRFNYGYLESFTGLRFDAAGNATNCLEFADNNDYHARRCMFQDADAGVLIRSRNNWVDECWMERCTGNAIEIKNGKVDHWITNPRFLQ